METIVRNSWSHNSNFPALTLVLILSLHKNVFQNFVLVHLVIPWSKFSFSVLRTRNSAHCQVQGDFRPQLTSHPTDSYPWVSEAACLNLAGRVCGLLCSWISVLDLRGDTFSFAWLFLLWGGEGRLSFSQATLHTRSPKFWKLRLSPAVRPCFAFLTPWRWAPRKELSWSTEKPKFLKNGAKNLCQKIMAMVWIERSPLVLRASSCQSRERLPAHYYLVGFL